ncbi:hypothetical protein AWJ20_4646 [Sugiyamaella lignohabitans]|uniref:Uncharacterized protein n=1 Tax=Sugiyamaella lignohabitans TaxID=796027 RepID=A0A167E6G2_9ASCO|nr:uncharacterized protein AWJ20_4646 [Sugiyamaella lignohabitans]ANB13703.1 hypothetical protein AWJ20_4646 [Sugiyamaella lignohabitans]
MVQTALKKSSSLGPTKSGKVSKHSKNPKKAAPKQIAPKKRGAVEDKKIAKKHSAALTSATEKLLASRVGHLELLKGTRRELEKKEKEKKKKEAKK